MTNFDYNFSGPYFFFNKLISIIDADDKINRSPKDERFVFSYVEIKEKRIFSCWIKAKWEPFLLYSFHLNGICVYFVDTKPKFGSGIDQHYAKFLYFKELVIFNGYPIDVEYGYRRLILINYFLLNSWQFMKLRCIICIFQLIFFKIVDFIEGRMRFFLS